MPFAHSKDNILKEVRKPYENSSNFFAGDDIRLKKKIAIEKKPTTKPLVEEDEIIEEEVSEEEISGLENLIKSFGEFKFEHEKEPVELDDYNGNEGLIDRIKNLVNNLIEFVKSIFRWIYDFFTNKIAKTDTKVKYAEQRKKLHGIRIGEIKYPPTVRRLVIPDIVSVDPNWVIESLNKAEKFYDNFLKANKYLKEVIKTVDVSKNKDGEFNLYEWKLKTTNELGKILFNNNKKGNVYQTDVLPGNKYFNLSVIDNKLNTETKPFFSDSTGDANLRSPTYTSSNGLLDNVMKSINTLNDKVKNSQRNVSQLNNDFQKEIKKIYKDNDYKIANDTKKYFTWVTDINKTMTSLITQYIIHCIDGALDFYNSGVKNAS